MGLREGGNQSVRKAVVKELYSGEDGGIVTNLAKEKNLEFGRPRPSRFAAW